MKCRGVVEGRGPVGLAQDRVRVGDKVRKGGWLCELCSAVKVRVVNHIIGGHDLNHQGGWKVNPGYVVDNNHAWLKCVVGPGKGPRQSLAIMDDHESMLLNMRNTEVEAWVDEEEEEEQVFPEDDEEFLAIVDEVEAAFDEDDALLLTV